MGELLNEMIQKGMATTATVSYFRNVSPQIMLRALVACEISDYYVPLVNAERRIGKLFEFSPNLDHKTAWTNPLAVPFGFSRN